MNTDEQKTLLNAAFDTINQEFNSFKNKYIIMCINSVFKNTTKNDAVYLIQLYDWCDH